MKVTFLGAGVYGKALGNLAESNGHEVKYYDPYKFPEVKLADVAKARDLIVYAAPAGAVNQIVPELPDPEIPLLCVSKGIMTPYPFRRLKHFYMLAGAAFAEDIENDSPRIGDKILLTASTPLAEELFTAPKIGIEYIDDTRGIMLSASLKVATSVYAGYLYPDGFKEDELDIEKAQNLPSKQEFLEKIRPEYEKWYDLNGCSHELLQLSCGFPDIILSTTMTSRNFSLGCQIRKLGRIPAELGTVEGLTFYETIKNYPDLKVPEDSILMEFGEQLKTLKGE
ncbi:hypothetical protein IJJ46_01765 [Candidatus Saccharibacteria bacterium]|nr:hypothetical protein [Candidatus Saccharibacteria bacterium]